MGQKASSPAAAAAGGEVHSSDGQGALGGGGGGVFRALFSRSTAEVRPEEVGDTTGAAQPAAAESCGPIPLGSSGALVWDQQAGGVEPAKPKPYPNLKAAAPKSALKKKGKELKVTMADVEAEEKAEQQRQDDELKERIARRERLQATIFKAADPWSSFASTPGKGPPSAASTPSKPRSRNACDSPTRPSRSSNNLRKAAQRANAAAFLPVTSSSSPLLRLSEGQGLADGGGPGSPASSSTFSDIGLEGGAMVQAVAGAGGSCLAVSDSSCPTSPHTEPPSPSLSGAGSGPTPPQGLLAALSVLGGPEGSASFKKMCQSPSRRGLPDGRPSRSSLAKLLDRQAPAAGPASAPLDRLVMDRVSVSENIVEEGEDGEGGEDTTSNGVGLDQQRTSVPLLPSKFRSNPALGAIPYASPRAASKVHPVRRVTLCGSASPPPGPTEPRVPPPRHSHIYHISSPNAHDQGPSRSEALPSLPCAWSPGSEAEGPRAAAPAQPPHRAGLSGPLGVHSKNAVLAQLRVSQGLAAAAASGRDASSLGSGTRGGAVGDAYGVRLFTDGLLVGPSDGEEREWLDPPRGGHGGTPTSGLMEGHGGDRGDEDMPGRIPSMTQTGLPLPAMPPQQRVRSPSEPPAPDLDLALALNIPVARAAVGSPAHGRRSRSGSPGTSQAPSPRSSFQQQQLPGYSTTYSTPAAAGKLQRYSDGPNGPGDEAPGSCEPSAGPGLGAGTAGGLGKGSRGKGCLKKEGAAFKVTMADVEVEERAAERAEEEALEAAAEERLRRRRELQGTMVKAPPSIIRRAPPASSPGTESEPPRGAGLPGQQARGESGPGFSRGGPAGKPVQLSAPASSHLQQSSPARSTHTPSHTSVSQSSGALTLQPNAGPGPQGSGLAASDAVVRSPLRLMQMYSTGTMGTTGPHVMSLSADVTGSTGLGLSGRSGVVSTSMLWDGGKVKQRQAGHGARRGIITGMPLAAPGAQQQQQHEEGGDGGASPPGASAVPLGVGGGTPVKGMEREVEVWMPHAGGQGLRGEGAGGEGKAGHGSMQFGREVEVWIGPELGAAGVQRWQGPGAAGAGGMGIGVGRGLAHAPVRQVEVVLGSGQHMGWR